ncbi:roadblock/LC7 domain-containing protein [Halostreptopolyspora alba]|uniref:Roadblock/LC7 domain-containing protein n=1 Tax=Halostreptopolyspora alba TaxID=2487137 RepID=A0A3N0EDZ6_9ACTN|nr:roadblock/LC7 domain-containing protein [Nocardiopsaceae bacterium YIM 96095]
MSADSSSVQQFTWLVDKFVRDVPGVRHALVVSSDGLRLAASEGLGFDLAEKLAAVASGVFSLAQEAARIFDQGECERTVIRMEQGRLFIVALSDGSCFTVLANDQSDMKVISYQMAMLVDKAAHVLTPHLRSQLREATVE